MGWNVEGALVTNKITLKVYEWTSEPHENKRKRLGSKTSEMK